MEEREIRNIILLGENVNTELKMATNSLPKNLFETVCAFLNTTGGYIILGVNDNKEIIGINKEYVTKLKKDFTTMCNNEQIINPTIIAQLDEIEIDKKILLYVHIQESHIIHKHKEKVLSEIMKAILIFQIIYHLLLVFIIEKIKYLMKIKYIHILQ